MFCFVTGRTKPKKSSNPCHVHSLKAFEIDFQQFHLWNFKDKNISVQGSIFVKNVYRSLGVKYAANNFQIHILIYSQSV